MTHEEFDVSVRLALPEDVDVLCDMMQQFNALERIPWTRARALAPLLRLLGDDSLGLVMLAEHDEQTLGYAVMTWGFDLEWGGRDAFLTELYVDPEHRRQGVGAVLMHQAELIARDHEVKALHLLVHDDHIAARSLYMRSGFHEVERVFMSKEL